jgi:hypothetical protein
MPTVIWYGHSLVLLLLLGRWLCSTDVCLVEGSRLRFDERLTRRKKKLQSTLSIRFTGWRAVFMEL